MRLLLLLSAIFCCASVLHAQQNRYIAMDGSDSGNTCADTASPCLTITHALEEATAGDTLNVAAGTFTETMTITKRITIRGEGADNTIIQAHVEPGQADGRVINVRPASQMVIIEGVTIRHGNATGFSDSGWGGGIFVELAGLRMHNARVIDNTASRGGGIYISSSSPRLVNVEILRNEATQAGQGGGGMFITASTSAPVLINTVIYGNKGQYGGGIYMNNDSRPELINATISGNEAEYGGGLYIWLGAHATLTNTIVWGNEAEELGNEIYNATSGSAELSHSLYRNGPDDINEGGGFDLIAGNLTSDPLFRNAEAGNLRLRAGSPAIMTGSSAPYSETGAAFGVLTDPDGNDRIFGDSVDMGAYEFDGSASSVESLSDVPSSVVLHQNYPNPFNPSTTIGFYLPEASDIRLTVHDMLGREVGVLAQGPVASGEHSVVFDASQLPGGVYMYRLTAGSHALTRKLTLIK